VPWHRFAPGVHTPVHWPPTHAKVHAAAEDQLPLESQLCGTLPEHWSEPGAQLPVHAPALQTFVQTAPFAAHWPCALHWRGCFPWQSCAPGVHTPVHCPAPLHTKGHGVPSFHVPFASHVRGVLPAHCTDPGVHSPQVPAPLHTPPAPPSAPVPHVVPAALFGNTGFGPSHDSLVHALPSSAGTSAVSAAVAKAPPSPQLIFLQSPFTCAVSGTFVPAGAALLPHTPPTHTATSHGLAGAGHSFAEAHGTGAPPASTVTVPPPLTLPQPSAMAPKKTAASIAETDAAARPALRRATVSTSHVPFDTMGAP
jgi:hypothetical protein